MLGELPNGSHLAGLDLDHCINAKTNKIEAWACEIVDRFDTYAEVSPSGLGIKAFFIVDATDVAQVEMLLGRQMGKAFKADARTGIEFYLGSRYFAVTDDRLDDATPETLRTVTVDDVRWLLQEAVPAFLAKHGKPQAAKGRDQTGSGFGFRFFGQRKRAGDSFEETREGVQADDGPAGDWARTCADERQFQRAWDRQKANSTEEDTRPLVARSIDQFERQELQWLWPPFFPLGLVTLLSGDKGTGKSSVMLDLAARISTGSPLPRFGHDKAECAPKGSVIILCQEDDIPRMIRPRLEAAGADLSRIHTLGYEVPDEPTEFDLIERLDTKAKELGKMLEQIGDVELIVIDPTTDYVGQGDLNRDTDVRQLLNPLVRLAARYDLSIVNIIHHNKKADLKVKYRPLGSVAFRNVAKSSVLVAKAEMANEFYLAQECSNLTPWTRAVTYSTVSEGDYHRVEWGSDWEEVDVDELMEAQRPKKQQRAETMLREWLADGPVDTELLRQKAKDAGIGWRTVERAKAAIKADSVRAAKGRWTWKLSGD